jgi:hypothetical protein
MSEELSQNSGEFTGSSEYNVLDFVIRSIVCGLVNTAIPVRVDKVERPAEGGGAGYLSATPLIKMRSAKGDALDVVSIPKLRWFRLQHGTAAIIVDPKPGDIGLAVFAQQDVSALNGGSEPIQPGSFRCYSISDGFYFGGFWGQKPTTFIRIEDNGQVTVTAPQSVVVNSIDVTVNASGSTKIDSPSVTITGDTTIEKTLTVKELITGTGGMTVSGGSGASVTGNMSVSGGDVTADGVGLKSHTHTCPQGGETSIGHG